MSVLESALDLLVRRRFVVLTGAGMSTDSGIPDYRGPRPAGAPAVRMPMTYQEFVASPANQQRYWARAHLGWSRMRDAAPNDGHRALAALPAEQLALLMTQNVDGLHERAGQNPMVALHGRIAEVACLDCGRVVARTAVQSQMQSSNPEWVARHRDVLARPDGDVALEETADFVVPHCQACGGRLKPHVVFFGENVPRPRVQQCIDAVERAEALLVLGSSLTVMSGLRFVRQAARAGTPVVIVNRGTTRGDDLADVRLDMGCSEFAEQLLRGVTGQPIWAQGRQRTETAASCAASLAMTSSPGACSTSTTA